MDLSTAKVYQNEIVKHEDFDFGFVSLIKNGMLVDRMLADTINNYVVGGALYIGANNVSVGVRSLYGNGRGFDLPILSESDIPPINVQFPASGTRIDTVQVKSVLEGYDIQQRQFLVRQDGGSAVYEAQPVATKQHVRVILSIKQGAVGSGQAPVADADCLKVGELVLNAADVVLSPAHLRNITAQFDGDVNTAWTNERTAVFILGSINTEKRMTMSDEPADSVLVGLQNETLKSKLQKARNNLKALFSYFNNGSANNAELLGGNSREYFENLVLAPMVEGYGRDLCEVFGITSGTVEQKIAACMAEIRRRCNNNGEIDASGVPDFRGIAVGDYLDGIDLSAIPAENGGDAGQAWNDTYKNNRIVVSGFNTFKGSGDTETDQNHILFTFRNIPLRKRMNATDTNTGGYPASELRAFLEGVNGDGTGAKSGVTTAAFLNALKVRLAGGGSANYILPIRRLLSNKGARVWVTCSLWLPGEEEVFGATTLGEANHGEGLKVQFPIYQTSTVYRGKRYNGARHWWWEQSPFSADVLQFCNVSGYSDASAKSASAVGGCAPAFCVA